MIIDPFTGEPEPAPTPEELRASFERSRHCSRCGKFTGTNPRVFSRLRFDHVCSAECLAADEANPEQFPDAFPWSAVEELS